MSTTHIELEWEKPVQEKFHTMIRKIPMFHRTIAQQVVEKKAVQNALDRGAGRVGEGDVVRAFLSEVPLAFYSLMIRLMHEVGFDYHKYET